MNVKVISRNVGFALLVSALFMFLSVLVSMANGNDSALAALLISFLITFTVGIFPFIFVRKHLAISLTDGYLIIFLSWILSFIVGMLPYALWGGPFTLANAWFESVSGFTTCGATILEDIESVPNSLLFWRSSTHFIGGLGVVVFLLLIIPESSPMRLRLTNMEVSSLSRSNVSERANSIVLRFSLIYIGLALVAFLCYMLAGMSAFDAINHAFSVSATGGFSTRNLSIGAFDSKLIEAMTMLFMLISSIHFGLLYACFVTRSFKPLNNPVIKFYLCSLVAVSLATALSLSLSGKASSPGEALWNGTFHTICMATTAGFAIADNSTWPLLSNLAIFTSGIMCACAGSTSGGVKADRVFLLAKTLLLQISKVIKPSSIKEVKVGDRYFRDQELTPHLVYLLMYVLIIGVSTFLALITGLDGVHSLSGSIASLGNLGPALGDMGTYGNYNFIPSSAKLLFSLDMFLGRVEIYPVLAVFAMLYSRLRR